MPKAVAPSQGLGPKRGSLTTVHDIEEAIVILVISVDIRHQSRCTGTWTVSLEATGVQLHLHGQPGSAKVFQQAQMTSLDRERD